MKEKTGIELISVERKRQVEEEGWTREHDSQHTSGELAIAAACYASPEKIYIKEDRYVQVISFKDPFPWDHKFDKRFRCSKQDPGKKGNKLPDLSLHTKEERVDLLIKAGALIAAEIDRIKGL